MEGWLAGWQAWNWSWERKHRKLDKSSEGGPGGPGVFTQSMIMVDVNLVHALAALLLDGLQLRAQYVALLRAVHYGIIVNE